MMFRHFNSKICNDFENLDSDDDNSSGSESATVDSDIEFHLYSQVHYSSAFSNVDDDGLPESPCVVKSEDENQSSGTKDTVLKIEEFSKALDKEDISDLNSLNTTGEDDFIPESWEIVDSVDDSDDANVEVHFSAVKYDEEEKNDAWIPEKGPPSAWKIDSRDKKSNKIASKGRYYDDGQSRARCRNCNEAGHLARDCTADKREPVCFMCGNRGHMGRECPERRNHKFSKKHIECNRCRQQGHFKSDCPDLWRQYHVTTNSNGPIVVPDIPVKLNDREWCYNCGEKGHYGFECDEPRHQYHCPILKPLVHRYDDRVRTQQDLRKKLDGDRVYQGGNRKQKNRRIVFRSSSEEDTPAKRSELHEESALGKRKKTQHTNENLRTDSESHKKRHKFSAGYDQPFPRHSKHFDAKGGGWEKAERSRKGSFNNTEFHQPSSSKSSRKRKKDVGKYKHGDTYLNDRGFKRHF